MPLPTKDPVAFRGVPSLGADKKMALSMTFTQKQVEAMFGRQAALRESGSSNPPLEIDFENNKIYIGDIATPFNSFKEDGTREICQRSPTVSKPLAGITLAGHVIGKLNIHRNFDQDVADNIRKATEAEQSKRNERTIVRLDTPPVLNNGKKNRSGASTLAKKAMSNRIVSAQGASKRPPMSSSSNRPSNPTTPSSTVSHSTPPSSSTRPTPPSSRSLSVAARPPSSASSATPTTFGSAPRETDLTSLRARLAHYLALYPRTTQQVLLEIGGRSPSPETVREIEDTLTAVAEEIPPPKKGPSGPVMWELRTRSWEHIRPYEWPDLTSDQRTRMARKGRLACGQIIPASDPFWEHFKTRVPDANAAALPPPGKGRAKATPGQPLVKISDFKGGMFPKEKKANTKGGGVASGSITKTKASSTKSKIAKEQEVEVEVEAKARKVVDGLAVDAKCRGKVNSSPPITSSTTATATKIPKAKKQEQVEVSSTSTKTRSSPGITKRETPPLPPKPRRSQTEGIGHKRKTVDIDEDDASDMEEGELPVKLDAKKRRITESGDSNKSKFPNKQNESRDTNTRKSTKEKNKKSVKEESTPPKLTEPSAIPRVSVSLSSTSSRTATSGNKGQRFEKEERELERLEEREREKSRTNGKRGRRATPSFSSDDEEEDGKDAKLSTLAPAPFTAKAKLPPHPPSSKLAALTPKPIVVSSRASAPSPALPSNKEAMRRRYHTCYARYISVTSKFHEQRAKVEALLATDGDNVSADDDMDMMDAEQLMQLRGEHERLRDELERILDAHANGMVF